MFTKSLFTLLAGAALTGTVACSTHGSAAESQSPATNVPTITIYRHSAWDDHDPKGVEADGIRRNLAPGDSFTFKDITVGVTEITPAETEGGKDTLGINLAKDAAQESKTVLEGDAFNWQDYHIAIVAVYTRKGELGFGSAAIEVATLKSLPPEVANSPTANGAEHRLRVKHKVDKLTLHHSATPHNPGDDLGQKMRNMQTWGENDRNWFDIPYHYMVDLDGTVFQARDHQYVGDTNTRYDPTGHFLINCFGNYSEAQPNDAQLATIANLMAWAAMEYDIDPLTIYGHRDLAQTSCPGDNLYRYIQDGTLERMVRQIMENGQPKLVWLDEIKPAPSAPESTQ